jgi:DNA replication and repair protein RecF
MIARLTLKDFRNFSECQIAFESGATLFRGRNGQGKTNLLEAVYYLSALRSFRQVAAPQLVRAGATGFRIAATLGEPAQDDLLVSYDGAERKRLLELNGNRITRAVDFAGRLNCVILHGADLRLARGRHLERLRWIDFSIAQIEPGYLQLLARFQRNLKHRNAALKQRVSGAELDALNETYAAAAAAVVDRRRYFWPDLSRRLVDAYDAISRSAETLGAVYGSEVDEAMAEKISRMRAAEIDAGTSLIGPQRDTVELTLRNLPVGHASSEGQARTLALGFKIAQARFIREHLGRPPVLLIDDVWGELDAERRSGLELLMAESPQILLTSTDVSSGGIPSIAGKAIVWEVVSGALKRTD